MNNNRNEEIVLGVDPGSIKTGFGLIRCQPGHIVHMAHGTILLDRKKNLFDRISGLSEDLMALIKKYNPTRAAVEDVFLAKNPRAALVLGQARGAVIAVLGMNNISIDALQPTAIKAIVCGRGRADKIQVAKILAMELNISVPKSQDSSDALAAAFASAHLKNRQLFK